MPAKRIPVRLPSGHKWCFHCTLALPRDAFAVERRRRDGLTASCRGCLRTRRKVREEIRSLVEEAAIRMSGQDP